MLSLRKPRQLGQHGNAGHGKRQLGPIRALRIGIEHMLCEFRKMRLPGGRRPRRTQYADYVSLWEEAAPAIQSLRNNRSKRAR